MGTAVERARGGADNYYRTPASPIPNRNQCISYPSLPLPTPSRCSLRTKAPSEACACMVTSSSVHTYAHYSNLAPAQHLYLVHCRGKGYRRADPVFRTRNVLPRASYAQEIIIAPMPDSADGTKGGWSGRNLGRGGDWRGRRQTLQSWRSGVGKSARRASRPL